MIAIAMGGNDNLIARKVFGKAQTDFVRGLGCELVIGAERLDNVVILSAVGLAEFVFTKRNSSSADSGVQWIPETNMPSSVLFRFMT